MERRNCGGSRFEIVRGGGGVLRQLYFIAFGTQMDKSGRQFFSPPQRPHYVPKSQPALHYAGHCHTKWRLGRSGRLFEELALEAPLLPPPFCVLLARSLPASPCLSLWKVRAQSSPLVLVPLVLSSLCDAQNVKRIRWVSKLVTRFPSSE